MKRFSCFIVLWILLFTVRAKAADREYFLLITGCGRSGTTYISELLRESGLDIGHEGSLGKDGTASWFGALDNVYAQRYGTKELHFQHTFHQVRHPLDVISSWYCNKIMSNSWNVIYAHVPQIVRNEPHLAQCAKYWYYWNLKAEKKADWRYRIEDINKVFGEMAKRLGKPLDKIALKKVSKDINTREKISSKITWKDLQKVLSRQEFANIQKMAKRYGYSIKD